MCLCVWTGRLRLYCGNPPARIKKAKATGTDWALAPATNHGPHLALATVTRENLRKAKKRKKTLPSQKMIRYERVDPFPISVCCLNKAYCVIKCLQSQYLLKGSDASHCINIRNLWYWFLTSKQTVQTEKTCKCFLCTLDCKQLFLFEDWINRT